MAWFTPKRRKAIYKVAIALGGLAMAAGILTPDMLDSLGVNLDKINSMILALTGLLAVLNVNSDE